MTKAVRRGFMTAMFVLGLASSLAAEEQHPRFGHWAARRLRGAEDSVAIDARATAAMLEKTGQRARDVWLNVYLTCLDYVEIQTAKTPAGDLNAGQVAPERYLERALDYFEADEYDAALEVVNIYLKLDPNLPEAWLLRGNIWSAKRQLLRAIHNSTRAIELNPDDVDAYLMRAGCRLEVGDAPRALEDAEKALALDPQAIHFVLSASIHSRLEDHAGALADLDKAIELEPNNAFDHHERGAEHDLLGDLDAAIADYSRAIELNPKMAFAYAARAIAWTSKRDAAKAEADLKEARRLAPASCPLPPKPCESLPSAEGTPDSERLPEERIK